MKVSVTLEPEVQLACDLTERRYRVTRKTIFNLAPLLFTLIAEGSLAWRREKLADAENAAERLSIMLPLGVCRIRDSVKVRDKDSLP